MTSHARRPSATGSIAAAPAAIPGNARGAALLLVMWLIALLTALVGAFALTSHIENLQGRVLVRGLAAEQAARAGLEYALTRVAAPEQERQWLPDGRPYRWEFDDAEVEVRLIDEAGKIDLNAADAPLLTGLFQAVGVEQSEAAAISSAILDWRDPDPLTQPAGGAEDPEYAAAQRPYGAKDAPFDTVAEVEQVLGMTPALYEKVVSHLTVYSGTAQPEVAFASTEVLTAMGQDPALVLARRQTPGPTPLVATPSGTYSVSSRARLRNGREAVLRVVARAGASGVPGSAYTPLRWEDGASPR